MTLNLKVLGLAVSATLALGLVAASAASAEGVATSDGNFSLVGTELAEGNELKYPSLPGATCVESHFSSTLNESGSGEFTVNPNYTNCKVGIFPATVKMTSCDFDFVLGNEVSEDTYDLGANLSCESAGDVVHLEVYSDGGHSNRICTITFGEQDPTSDLHATDTGNGNVRIHGTATEIHATKSGGGCGGPGTTTEALYEVNVEVTGESEGGAETDVSLSG